MLDTNTLVSGVISANGPPRRLLDEARAQTFEICTCTILLPALLLFGWLWQTLSPEWAFGFAAGCALAAVLLKWWVQPPRSTLR